MSLRLFVRGRLVLGQSVPTACRVLAQEAASHGTVTARADGSAVPGAAVQLQGGALPVAIKTTTAADGQFAFTRLAPADYVLIVTHADFGEQRYQLSLKPREEY